ncbi:Mitochondrial thiamine pyrophosphate carrier [Geodia barretti]|uniref:Mitochondrial thiamine pyrophosphate carrier n=1 Tax=Geodia barretti TaxID=519541 RepID=A0AA35SMY3_GEOBA|nr:Mitochondrial thiamine pyrophosphate carrier [Geodia barretti]
MKDSLVAGSVSGALTRLFTCPLDVLKIRFQLQLEPISQLSQSSKYKSVLDAVRTILREEGIRAFWKGMFVGQVLYVVYSGTQFYTFETCKARVHETFPNLSPQLGCWLVLTNFGVGTVAGGVAAFASHPLDVIRTRFVGQGEPKIYPSVPRAVILMYHEKGVLTFYRGPGI